MNPAEAATKLMIEKTLASSPAYRKIDEHLYTIKQGSSYVLITIVPWGSDRALVRCVAQLVKGVHMEGGLALQLLQLNAHLRFGAFAYDPRGELVIFQHSILGGDTLDAEELLATVRDVAIVADKYDDRISARYGGQTMKDLIEEAAFARILEEDAESFGGASDSGGKS
jgi:hypothetical protein